MRRNPWAYGVPVSHRNYATHANILTSTRSTGGHPAGFTAAWNAPLPTAPKDDPLASAPCLSPVTLSAPDHSTSELLRTLSMMAASGPTSWLSLRPDFLSH
uniref:Uncharacterized protein n=1 Tax=uncultured Chloroflexi bacterium HF0200_09I09 TaxID=710736 RepID=E0XU74_9CHLR|nr:hypothetical protein [uncultured Chloroflexi bacterium HF0200_09I09]